MPIPMRTPIEPHEYHRLHSRLRRRLAKIAFNNYYKCARCGCHEKLEIHIPDPVRFKEDQPGFFMILCQRCHKLEK